VEHSFVAQIWPQLVWPLIRITFFISIGLIIANCIESLNWTHRLAALARPLIKMGRLSPITGASFSVAFFSGVSANSMLAEAYDAEKITKSELVLANLFNSLPRFFLHLPTVFFLTVPLIKSAAVLYVGLTFVAALMQTSVVVFSGRLFLPTSTEPIIIKAGGKGKPSLKEVIAKSLKRLKKRMLKLLKFMIPVYILFFLLNLYGLFAKLEELRAAKAWFLSGLSPPSLGIVILHVTTEFSAGLAAASVLLAENSLSAREVVLALLAGNILAAPIRAIRHQLPYYTGIYNPSLALQLVTISQLARGLCVIGVAVCYYFITQ